MKRYYTTDYILLALLISFVTLQPYFMHGAINFYETGLYLPQINEIFYGKMPYRDMFILRGPLEVLMPAFLTKIFGMHISGLSAYFYFGTVITLIIYAFFALAVFRTRGFVYLFALVLAARTFPRVSFAFWGGIRFGLGILAILFAVNFLQKKKRANLWLFFAGVLSSIAFWTSFEVGAFSFTAILAMLGFFSYFEAKDIKQWLRYAAVYVLGNVLVSVPIVFYLLFQNAFIDYITAVRVVLFNTSNVFDPALCFNTPGTIKEFIAALLPWNHNFKYILPFLFYVFIGVWLFRNVARKKIAISELAIIPVFIYAIFLYKGAFRNIEGPHYRMMLQPLLLIMFFYLEKLCGYFKNAASMTKVKRAAAIVLAVIIPLYSIGFSIYKYNKRFFIFKEIKSLAFAKRHADIPYTEPDPARIKSERAKGIIVSGRQAEEVDAVVNYISANTVPRESVLAFPDLGAYNFLADRPPVGRFYCAELSFMDAGYFKELLSDIKREKPRYVICALDFSRLEPFRPTVGKYLDEVNEFLNRNYETARVYASVKILKAR